VGRRRPSELGEAAIGRAQLARRTPVVDDDHVVPRPVDVEFDRRDTRTEIDASEDVAAREDRAAGVGDDHRSASQGSPSRRTRTG
jgi:hypothetical protein